MQNFSTESTLLVTCVQIIANNSSNLYKQKWMPVYVYVCLYQSYNQVYPVCQYKSVALNIGQ